MSYRDGDGWRPGVLVGDSVVDVDRCGGTWGSVKELIATASATDLGKLASEAERVGADAGIALADVVLGPPIPDPEKVLCIGLNYRDHVEEAKDVVGAVPDPVVFAKFPNALVGDGADVVLPAAAPDQVDYEGELAVVIGKTASRVSQADALDHVAGYMNMNDVSARDLQLGSPQWTMGKAFDTSGPCGPALVTRDEVPDPQDLELETILNGEIVQSTSTGLMIHSIARLVEYISSVITLVPGDIISTGTPAGVGLTRDPKLFMRDGDSVTVRITGLGELTNPVVAA
ncbi:MAG TPA: fumarylacetoacetate hydrolase family protein [Baekduia sp.]|nr:fumarylacetoacetate hydrolase family protein [Baekduia sp.]